MNWTNPIETVDATPFLQTLTQAMPPYLDKQQLDLYASLTEPLLQQSADWMAQLTEQYRLPLSDFKASGYDAEGWMNWIWETQQQYWTQWSELCQHWPQTLTEVVNSAASIDPAAALEPLNAETPTVTAEQSATVTAAVLDEAADDLTAIAGIGPGLARKLDDAGIKSYADIAAWSAADIDDIEKNVLGGRFVGRIQRDDWIGQALALSMRG